MKATIKHRQGFGPPNSRYDTTVADLVSQNMSAPGEGGLVENLSCQVDAQNELLSQLIDLLADKGIIKVQDVEKLAQVENRALRFVRPKKPKMIK